MDEYPRTWHPKPDPIDLEPETPTGRACVWPIIIMLFVAVYILWQLIR